jgi:hypothetical protein
MLVFCRQKPLYSARAVAAARAAAAAECGWRPEDRPPSESGCRCEDWSGPCQHCVAKDVLATSAVNFHGSLHTVLRLPDGGQILVEPGDDLVSAVDAWHVAWRAKL